MFTQLKTKWWFLKISRKPYCGYLNVFFRYEEIDNFTRTENNNYYNSLLNLLYFSFDFHRHAFLIKYDNNTLDELNFY